MSKDTKFGGSDTINQCRRLLMFAYVERMKYNMSPTLFFLSLRPGTTYYGMVVSRVPFGGESLTSKPFFSFLRHFMTVGR